MTNPLIDDIREALGFLNTLPPRQETVTMTELPLQVVVEVLGVGTVNITPLAQRKVKVRQAKQRILNYLLLRWEELVQPVSEKLYSSGAFKASDVKVIYGDKIKTTGGISERQHFISDAPNPQNIEKGKDHA